jgi:hypothetical protein
MARVWVLESRSEVLQPCVGLKLINFLAASEVAEKACRATSHEPQCFIHELALITESKL